MLQKTAFVCIAMAALVSPWFFGCWEQWWFWPFAALIFTAGGLAGILMMRANRSGRNPAALPDTSVLDPYADESRLAALAFWSYIPFIAYAAFRVLSARVYMDSERSFLLHLTPFILSAAIAVFFSVKRLELFYRIILANLACIALYGIINHALTGSKLVLWAQGYEGYTVENRMTGTYFCPDHFSGIMEIAYAMSLGLVFSRETTLRSRIIAGILIVLSVFCVIMSKSRGGGLTLIVVFVCALAFGLGQWRTGKRWMIRGISAAAAVLILTAFWYSGTEYINRFKVHFGLDSASGKNMSQIVETARLQLLDSCRGRMYAGAIRAWESSDKLFGIGPGMHQHLWPRFSASNDGDRANGIWPTVTNNDFHSYEVHSDWLQLLEEYGTLGLLLFFLPLSVITGVHFRALRHESRRRKRRDWQPGHPEKHGLILGGMLSIFTMLFHSLGDFNLQMPATVWMLSAVVTISTLLSIVSIYGNRNVQGGQ